MSDASGAKPTALLDPRQAITSYLDDLLREIPGTYADGIEVEATPPKSVAKRRPLQRSAATSSQTVSRRVPVEGKTRTQVRPPSLAIEEDSAGPCANVVEQGGMQGTRAKAGRSPAPAKLPDAALNPTLGHASIVSASASGGASTTERPAAGELSSQEATSARQPHNSGTSTAPAWARQYFQVLLFKVDGLTLAVPLVKLFNVIPATVRITAMPQGPSWYRGLLRHREKNVRIVDTKKLVVARQDSAADSLERDSVRHILIGNEGDWGLTCDEIGEVIGLQPDQVKWRTRQSKRPWLAGTVQQRLCALLNADAFTDLLKGAGRTRA